MSTLTAALGSFGATCIFVLILGGNLATEPAGMLIGFSVVTMFFTIPGALMLVGLRAMLIDRGLVGWATGTALLLFGAIAGGLILSFLSQSLYFALAGALFGFVTAIIFICLQLVFYGRSLN